MTTSEKESSRLWDALQYQLLRRLYPGGRSLIGSDLPPQQRRGLEAVFGRQILEAIRGKVVLDFGCGAGWESVELAQAGARRVIGLDIRESILEQARRNAAAAGVQEICEFTTSASQEADLIISVDAFEHFADPGGVLAAMHSLLVPGGEIWISFGPPWRHPKGGHLFSVFPWAHLILSEAALIRWRSDFKPDGARRFEEVEGGLNRLTIRRFLELVEASPFHFATLELVPIRSLRRLHNRWTRELFTSIVRCRLRRQARIKPEGLPS